MLTPENKLHVRMLYFYLRDAIDGPTGEPMPRDLERIDEWLSRERSRDDILNLHPDFVWCVDGIGGGFDPEVIRQNFIDGVYTLENIVDIWKAGGLD